MGPLHVKEIRSILDDVDDPFQQTIACVRQAYAELDFSCAHRTQSVGMCSLAFMKHLFFHRDHPVRKKLKYRISQYFFFPYLQIVGIERDLGCFLFMSPFLMLCDTSIGYWSSCFVRLGEFCLMSTTDVGW